MLSRRAAKVKVSLIVSTSPPSRIRDAYAEFFTRFDAVLLPVLPIPAHKYDLSEFVIAGQTVDVTHIQTFTVQFNITGIESISPAAIFTPTPRR
jgi:Asp-tRNA(Asn)/Glu-tRNA(Gln) amidotransferase A subunit family amidase